MIDAGRAWEALQALASVELSFSYPVVFEDEVTPLVAMFGLPLTARPGSVEIRHWRHPDEGNTLAVGVYDADGALAGVFRGGLEGGGVGIFKVAVREEYRRLGLGTRLLDAAQIAGCDIVGNVTRNLYTPEGLALVVTWLSRHTRVRNDG